MINTNIEKITWDYTSNPKCKNGDIVVLVQYGEAEIAKYITPKPKGAPIDGNDFIFEIREEDDNLAKELLKIILNQLPEIEHITETPLLFKVPVGYC